MSFLTPCHDCNRHVLASDRDCPFCGAVVTDAMRARVPRTPQGRLGRAALMAFSATVATTACGGSEDSSDTRQPANGSTTEPSGPAQPTPAAPNGTMIGMPNTPGSGGAPTTPNDEPMVSAEYGVPILPADPNGPVAAGGNGNVPGNPVAGGGMNNAGGPAGPVSEPEPIVMSAYGVPIVEPVFEPTPNGTAGAPPMETPDAGVGEADAGSTDGGLIEPVPEPEPNVFPAYGITPDFE